MKRVLLLPGLVSACLTVGAPLALGARPTLVLAQANGEIVSLSPSRIKVGDLTCSIHHGKPVIAAFVISDPVTIGCRNGVLASIKYTPAHASPSPTISSVAGVTSSAPSVPSGHPGAASSGTIAFSNSPTGVSASGTTTTSDGTTTSWVSTNARGTITAFGPSGSDACPDPSIAKSIVRSCASITVDSLSCSMDSLLYGFISPKYNVGDMASIACYDGVLRAIAHSSI